MFSRKILSTCLAMVLFMAAGLPALSAAEANPPSGLFVFDPQADETTTNNWAQNSFITINRWAQKGYFLSDVWIDANYNGRIDYAYLYYYDNSDRLTMIAIDETGDGVIDSTGEYFYDESGNVIRKEIDTVDNDQIEAQVHYYYNDDNTLDFQEIDEDNDGIIDQKISFVYDNGKLTRKQTYYLPDNDPVTVTDYFYDEDGRWSEKRTGPYDLTGTSQGIYRELYYYDDRGNLSLIVVNENYFTDEDVGGEITYDYYRRFEYDEEKRLEFQEKINERFDTGGSQKPIVEKTIYVWFAEEAEDDDKTSKPSADGCFLNSLGRIW